MNVDAVVVTYNSENYIRPCLDSLQKAGANIVIVGQWLSRRHLENHPRGVPPRSASSLRAKILDMARQINLGAAQAKLRPAFLSRMRIRFFPEGSVHGPCQLLWQNTLRSESPAPQQLFPDGVWQRSYGEVQGVWEVTQAF